MFRVDDRRALKIKKNEQTKKSPNAYMYVHVHVKSHRLMFKWKLFGSISHKKVSSIQNHKLKLLITNTVRYI